MKIPLDFQRIAAHADARITQVCKTAQFEPSSGTVHEGCREVDLHPKGMFRRIVTREVKPKLLTMSGPLYWKEESAYRNVQR